jgi:hypothetical protein
VKKLLTLFLALALVYACIIIYQRATTLPTGELICASTSPNGDYSIQAYLCDGGATTDQAIRAEVLNNTSGKVRNIYWQYHAYEADIKWLSDTLVRINGVELDVRTDAYDYRKDTEQSPPQYSGGLCSSWFVVREIGV